MTTTLASTYNRLPVTFTHGEGVWLYDVAGNRYLDALAGIAVNTLGHAHPVLVKAIAEQAGRLIHTSNIYQVPAQEILAEKLCTLSGMSSAFFCNSGAEANEAAIKLSRLWAQKKEVQNPGIVVFEQAFHGRTLATLSATGNSKVQKGFAPLVRGFHRAPFNDLVAVKQIVETTPDVVAVMLETIQGEGGIHSATPEFLKGLQQLCDERDLLLILDEVQCGIGRTGDWFAFQSYGIKPDVLTLAKGLGGGIPIGATLMSGRAEGLFKPGNHGSTFGGNPLAVTAARTVLEVIEKENLLINAANVGNLLQKTLKEVLGTAFPSELKGLKEVRGRGMMIGVEWGTPIPNLARMALNEKLLINVTHETVIRLLPPLIFGESHIAPLVERLVLALSRPVV